MKHVLIDTDPGIDDTLAILFALGRPEEINLLGLTCVFGNVPVETATRNALWLMDALGRPEMPVAMGASRPLIMEPRPHPAHIHGAHGFGPLPQRPETGRPQNKDAADFILETSKTHEGELHLVMLGPLTNLALAFQRDPDLPNRLASVHIMGGAFHVPGNASPFAEANIRNDPDAAAQVVASYPTARFIGLDVTTKTTLTASNCRHLASIRLPWGAFLGEITEFYLEFHAQKGIPDGAFLHDPTTLIALLMPELFQFQVGKVDVTTDGPEIGRTGLSIAPDLTSAAISLHSEAVESVFMDTLTGLSAR